MGGCASQPRADALAPPPAPPVVFGPQFALPHEAALNVKEKLFSWSGDDMTITDMVTETPKFKCVSRSSPLWLDAGERRSRCRRALRAAR